MEDAPSSVTPDLLEKARHGDESACDRIVELLYPLVSRIVWKQIGHSADREDVSQDVFMKIFLHLDQYRGPRPFEHWVSRIAVTTCYDWLRKRQARPIRSFSDISEGEAELVERTLSGNLGGDSIAQRELLNGLLDRLIRRLKPREQIVIRLLDLEELSIKEAQEITGWSASKIKTNAMRARRKLAQELRRLEARRNG